MSKKLLTKRDKLKKLEKDLQSRFDEQTSKIEAFGDSKNAKLIAIAAAGLLVGLITYKVLSSNRDGSKENGENIPLRKPKKNKFTSELISKAVKSVLPYIIDQLAKEKNNPNDPR